MANVYAWPPVAHVAAEWSVVDPVGRSRSMITGQSYVSAAQRRRRVASLDISALSLDRNGAGYMEVLKRLLAGIHLVRLTSTPINWHLDDEADNARRSFPMSWIVPSEPFGWTDASTDFGWWSGSYIATGVAGAGPSVTVSGLPPRIDVARPGEFVQMNGVTAMVVRPARSNDDGVAVLRLLTPLVGSGEIIIGARETGVFEPDEMPRVMQPTGQNWSYSWRFTEVFADERGPFTEINPWT